MVNAPNTNNVQTGNTETTKDVFSTFKQSSDKYFDAVEKTLPHYHQSVTSLQQEYLQAWTDAVDSTVDYQRKFANKTGINTKVPEATLTAVHNTNEQVIKAVDAQSKMTTAALDAARQNVKTFTNNAKAFGELNNNVMQSWISAFTRKRKSGQHHRYAEGKKRCQTCDIFIEWKGLYCPCCGMRVRNKPRPARELKRRFREYCKQLAVSST